MNIKDLYIQSYVGGTGLAKKEALQIPKAFNAKNRARIRELLGLVKSPYRELQNLTRNHNSGLVNLIPLDEWELANRGLDNSRRNWFWSRGVKDTPEIISDYDLATNPNMTQAFIDNIKNNIKLAPEIAQLPPDGLIKLNNLELHDLFTKFAIKRSIQKGGLQHLPETSPEGFTELYKGYTGTPFKSTTAAHRAPTTGGYAENQALWFAPHRKTAEGYGRNLAVFKTTPEIKDFSERTATPHMGSSVSWENRISGKARRDAQTIYKGKGGKHYQEDPNDVDYETVLPRQQWEYYLQHPELVTLYDKQTGIGYHPFYRRLLLE